MLAGFSVHYLKMFELFSVLWISKEKTIRILYFSYSTGSYDGFEIWIGIRCSDNNMDYIRT